MSGARERRRIDPSAALDVIARLMWIADRTERGEDGVLAADAWDSDDLLTDIYERFEALAREAVSARVQEMEANRG